MIARFFITKSALLLNLPNAIFVLLTSGLRLSVISIIARNRSTRGAIKSSTPEPESWVLWGQISPEYEKYR